MTVAAAGATLAALDGAHALDGPHVVGELPAPAALRAAYPLDAGLRRAINAHRGTIAGALRGDDDRLVVAVGPCSVHDRASALEYTARLATAATELAGDLVLVVRAYLEKPRTVVGWKGLLHDPALDGSDDLAAGLIAGRRFLLDAAALGLPLAYEFVDPVLAPYVADLVSWGAIGARTVASQPHRQLASWLPMPMGMKNGTSGSVGVAVDAVRAAAAPHAFPGVDPEGNPAWLRSHGNPDCHVVLRGGARPNYDAASVGAALAALRAAGLRAGLMVDASHGNSGKDHRRQPCVVADLADQVACGQRGIVGVMLESFLAEGRQEPGPGPLRYGVSVTDACLGWDDSIAALRTLAAAVQARRRRG